MSGLSLTIQQTTLTTRTWALLPGIREWVLVALVVVAVYARSGPVRSNRYLASLGRLVRPTRRGRPEPAVVRWLADRWMLVLALLAGVGAVSMGRDHVADREILGQPVSQRG